MAHLGYPRCVESPRGRCYTCGAVCGSDDRPSGVTIKELPAELRPRERLRSSGAGSLSTAELLGIADVSVGGLASAPVHPREVFKEAIRHSAAAVIVVHNHPSGHPEPSGDDVAITAQLRAAGRLMGIEILDHIIIGERAFVSLREQRQGFP